MIDKLPTISIINWEKFQHYKDRNPPWIKLYHSLLDNYEYSCLQDDSKLLLISLYMLAGRKNNVIPYDTDWIKSKTMIKGSVDIESLINYGFIKINNNNKRIDSGLIADCKQNACLETETETETETEKDVLPKGNMSGSVPIPDCPHQKIIDLYHEILPSLNKIQIWNDISKKHLKTRWRENPEHQTLDFWKNLFNYISESDFLAGKNDRGWQADLMWIVLPTNFAKIINGKYHNKKNLHSRLSEIGERWLQNGE